jgi:hypothetical protein
MHDKNQWLKDDGKNRPKNRGHQCNEDHPYAQAKEMTELAFGHIYDYHYSNSHRDGGRRCGGRDPPCQ